MANKYLLTFNTSTNKIEEVNAGDNLDLTSSGIVSVLGTIEM